MKKIKNNDRLLQGKKVLVTGGTGSLGKVLIHRLLGGEMGLPSQIVVFSRDEAKQHYMRLAYQNRRVAVNDFTYENFKARVAFRIGDIRDYHSVCSAIRDADVVVNAAALKQVPSCEYFPFEAVQTNVIGAENIVRSIRENRFSVETVVGVSTDKACKPVNVMGMTKAVQERIFISANIGCGETKFICVRYGNVIASRGSVIPLFHEQIRAGGPVTVTTEEMTRFLLTLNRAVDTIFEALRSGLPGEIYVPRVRSARVVDIARALVGERKIKVEPIGIRPGEKEHEILISEEEAPRSRVLSKDYFVISSSLPELQNRRIKFGNVIGEYSSQEGLMDRAEITELLKKYRLRIEDQLDLEREMLC